MTKLFTLVDCNNFFVSCERVFNPGLRKLPIAVLSNNDGCIVARSPEVKWLGIPMGAPLFQVQDLIQKHRVRVLSSNFALYGDMSRRVMQTLRQFDPEIEIYSIDEAFLQLEPGPNPIQAGQIIRNQIQRWTGIPVSIGIAPTKTLAKLANEYAKIHTEQEFVHQLMPGAALDQFLAQTPVTGIWGIGHRLAERLNRAGIYTAYDLTQQPNRWIRKLIGLSGLRTVLELRGTHCLSSGNNPSTHKQITSSRSFGHPVGQLTQLREAVASHIHYAAERLRCQKSVAGCIVVYLQPKIQTGTRAGSHRSLYHSDLISLPIPTNDTALLIRYAHQALVNVFDPGRLYRKAGINLVGLVPEQEIQLNLFQQSIKPEPSPRIWRVVDQINHTWGNGTISPAATGITKPWRAKSANRSPRYTTDWEELKTIRAS